MIAINMAKLLQIDDKHGFDHKSKEADSRELADYLKKIEQRHQGFYKVVDDLEIVEKINRFVDKVRGKFDFVVVLGIGGSALGTMCLQNALKNQYAAGSPQMIVVDNIDPEMIFEINEAILLEKTLFVVVTKSGNTPETLAAYFFFRKQIEDKGLEAKKHFVFITDAKKGLLQKIAHEDEIDSFAIPENVGGRFSVLTSAGLLPAALIGINIEELLKGARVMRDSFLSTDAAKNSCYLLAKIQFNLNKKGKIITVMMPYSQKLIRFADWYRQLLAESIGKAKNRKGEIVNVGITPINALGVTDQHSQCQLYNEGPNDKFFIFLHVEKFGQNPEIPVLMPHEESVSFLKNVTFTQLLHNEFRATRDVLTKNGRPNITINIEEINEYFLGQLFMLFEGSIAFLGEFYGINAYDQPGVELAKILTTEYLRRNF